jgi:hypothetical protein
MNKIELLFYANDHLGEEIKILQDDIWNKISEYSTSNLPNFYHFFMKKFDEYNQFTQEREKFMNNQMSLEEQANFIFESKRRKIQQQTSKRELEQTFDELMDKVKKDPKMKNEWDVFETKMRIML